MEKVIFQLKEPWRAGKLAEELEQAGIRVRIGSWRTAADIELEEELKEAAMPPLIVTDDPKEALQWVERGIPCLGYETGPEVRFEKIPMVIQGFEEIDKDFLAIVYNRAVGTPIVIARTERLIIRELAVSDLERLYELYEERGMCDYIPGLCRDKEKERQRLSAYIKNRYPLYGYGLWALVEKETGQMIGQAGLEDRRYKGEEVIELGYMIGSQHRRRGYGYEAAKEILTYAGEVLGLDKIYIFINPKNQASAALAKKLGFCFLEHADSGEDVSVLPGTAGQ